MWREQPNILRPQHVGTTFYLPDRGNSREPGVSRPSTSVEFARSPVNSCNLEKSSVPTEGMIDPMVDALLSRYRVENERLRDQIKANAVHQALLERRMHELSAKNTALHLRSFQKKDDNNDVEMLKKQLENRENQVRELQLQVKEQAGRIAAFEEAFARPSRDKEEHANSSHSLPSSSSSGRTHELLCQALSSVDYLTRVFNAIKHCISTPHGGAECPRSFQECTKRCLQVAMKGNQETAGEVMGRGFRLSCEELAIAVREEVQFCETAAVRIAAQLLTDDYFVSVDAVNASHEVAPGSSDKEPPREKSPTAAPQDLQTSITTSSVASKKVPRPSVDDCEVQ
ncbi:uncharacterized protein TM35_000791030 [Trypanosoma theileri]|uniref:Uncharacterized protein n=1 Tax=Trypanosoma theileri TaxID=67003 RepID=A0A1X0NFI1_9TRYP|nr:uncharacterized protein TM35_000791030 [Trypanosoma theileri]ORC82977.1 hypothetical protein TM35_000791030 [Trypanosoma theileri]